MAIRKDRYKLERDWQRWMLHPGKHNIDVIGEFITAIAAVAFIFIGICVICWEFAVLCDLSR